GLATSPLATGLSRRQLRRSASPSSVPPAEDEVHDPGDAEHQDQIARHPDQEPTQQGRAIAHARPRAFASDAESRAVSVGIESGFLMGASQARSCASASSPTMM